MSRLGLHLHPQFHDGLKVVSAATCRTGADGLIWRACGQVLDLDGRTSTYASDIPYGVGLVGLVDVQILLLRVEALVRKLGRLTHVRCRCSPPRCCRLMRLRQIPWLAQASLPLDAETVYSWVHHRSWTQATKTMLRAAVRTVFGAEPSQLRCAMAVESRCAGDNERRCHSMLYFASYMGSSGTVEDVLGIEGGLQVREL